MPRAFAFGSVLASALALLVVVTGCGGGDAGFTPFPAPDFSGTDLNPWSPSHGQVRTLSEERGEVVVLLFAAFACETCRQQFAELRGLYEGWRGEGVDADRLELWVVGPPIAGHQVAQFADGADTPCFIDGATGDESIFVQYRAEVDVLFVIDGEGTARYRTDLIAAPLDVEANRAPLDAWMRTLLR